MGFLPTDDCNYLTSKGISFEEAEDRSQKGIILREYSLPAGSFDVSTVDILIMLPAGYPDVPPDMFHTIPWIKLATDGRYPRAADQPVVFVDQNWQRWSRHNQEWRIGVDGIWTMLKRIEYALLVAA